MFIAQVISAVPQTPHKYSITNAVNAHAAILSSISHFDAKMGRFLHNVLRHKPFSCALIPSHDSLVRIRVVFYVEDGIDFCQSLLSTLNQTLTLRLGRVVCDIQSVDIGPSEWAGVANWADLLEGRQSEVLTLRFITPTTIRKTDGFGRSYSLLLPEPTEVFGGLHRRWDALGGPALDPDLAEILKKDGCIISYHRLETTSFYVSKRIQIGFQGSVTYRLRHPSPEFTQSICALARLAQYMGIGYQTARGMGLVQTQIGW